MPSGDATRFQGLLDGLVTWWVFGCAMCRGPFCVGCRISAHAKPNRRAGLSTRMRFAHSRIRHPLPSRL